MDNNQNIKPKYKNPFVVPVLSITILFIVVMTVSYGYLTTSYSVNTATHNITLPRRCEWSITNGSASLTMTRSQMVTEPALGATGAPPNTVHEAYGTTTSSYVRLNGEKGCSCSYNVYLSRDGDIYYKSDEMDSRDEFGYYVYGSGVGSISPTEGSYNGSYHSFANFGAGQLVGSGTITVATSGTQVTHVWTFHQEFRRFSDMNQIQQQGNVYKYTLRVLNPTCNF